MIGIRARLIIIISPGPAIHYMAAVISDAFFFLGPTTIYHNQGTTEQAE